VLRVQGPGAAALFAPEAGGHRFQRVPPTEKRGRVHSSTITVAVLAEPSSTEVRIAPHELLIETFRSGGPGGQHQNKTESGVRVRHLPTGITAEATFKSQHRNRELALAAIRARLAEHRREVETSARNDDRRKQVGTGMRSDKIRTVAMQRQRVEDHRNGKRMPIDRYLRGFLEEIQ
jgi:peptide chain release factor 1